MVRHDGGLSARERVMLSEWSANPLAPAVAIRARIVLLAADGMSNSAIAGRLGVSRPTVAQWVGRYRAEGILGLLDRPRPGRPRSVEDPEIVLRTLLTAPDEGSRWTSRTMAACLGISAGTVARVWRRWNLVPDELELYQLPTQPPLGRGITDLLGLVCGDSDQVMLVQAADRPRSHWRTVPPQENGVVTGHRLAMRIGAGDLAGFAAENGQVSRSLFDLVVTLLKTRRGCRVALICATGAALDAPVRRLLAAHGNFSPHLVKDPADWPEVAGVALGLAIPELGHGRPVATAVEALRSTTPARVASSWRDAWPYQHSVSFC